MAYVDPATGRLEANYQSSAVPGQPTTSVISASGSVVILYYNKQDSGTGDIVTAVSAKYPFAQGALELVTQALDYGHMTPKFVVAGDAVVLPLTSGSGNAFTLGAYDAPTGVLKWSVAVAVGYNAMAAGTRPGVGPVVVVYAQGITGNVTVYDARAGAVLMAIAGLPQMVSPSLSLDEHATMVSLVDQNTPNAVVVDLTAGRQVCSYPMQRGQLPTAVTKTHLFAIIPQQTQHAVSVVAVALGSCNVSWQHTVPLAVSNSAVDTKPAVSADGATVYVAVNGNVDAYDVATGAAQWSLPVAGGWASSSYNTVRLLMPSSAKLGAGDAFYMSTSSNSLTKIPTTGTPAPTVRQATLRIFPSPTCGGAFKAQSFPTGSCEATAQGGSIRRSCGSLGGRLAVQSWNASSTCGGAPSAETEYFQQACTTDPVTGDGVMFWGCSPQ